MTHSFPPRRASDLDDPRSVQAVYPRSRPDRAGALMRILLTNDDGYHAPGLKVLEEIAARFSDDVWVVAPTEEQSGAGHSLTLTRHLRIRNFVERRHAVHGTPTDAAMMAIAKIMAACKPDLIRSGVTRGANRAEGE